MTRGRGDALQIAVEINIEGECAVSSEQVEIEITNREAKLILKYGYPFADEEKIFERAAKQRGTSCIAIRPYWLELIMADLSRSIKEVRSRPLQEELDELCDVLQSALRVNAARMNPSSYTIVEE